MAVVTQVARDQANADRRTRAVWDDIEAVIQLSGDYDLSAVALLAEVLAAPEVRSDSKVTVDMSQVTFVDAAIMNVLTRTRELLALESRTLVLRDPPRSLVRVLLIGGLGDLVAPHTGDEAAERLA